jgi:hypothetical protein
MVEPITLKNPNSAYHRAGIAERRKIVLFCSTFVLIKYISSKYRGQKMSDKILVTNCTALATKYGVNGRKAVVDAVKIGFGIAPPSVAIVSTVLPEARERATRASAGVRSNKDCTSSTGGAWGQVMGVSAPGQRSNARKCRVRKGGWE